MAKRKPAEGAAKPARKRDDKIIPLHILDVLQRDAADGPFSRAVLVRKLAERGVSSNEDTVSRNMKALMEVFVDRIEEGRDGGRKCWQWVGPAPLDPEASSFTPGEARYLVDCAMSARRMPEAHKKRLVEKILNFAPQAAYGVHQYWGETKSSPDLMSPTSDNHHLIYVIETLLECIELGTQVSFQWGEVDARGNMTPTERWTTVMPYHLVYSGGEYYLLALYPDAAAGGDAKLYHFRVDFMFSACEALDAKGVELKVVPLENVKGFEGFNLRHYVASHPLMFSDPINKKVIFAIDDTPQMRHQFFQRFGQCGLVCTGRIGEEGRRRLVYPVNCHRTVALSWACQFADEVEILEPEDLRGEMLAIAQRMAEKYSAETKDEEE